MAKGDKYLKGKGRIWLDDLLYEDCYKCEFKRKEEYEEIDDPNGNGKVQIWVGFTLEGSVTIRKTGSMPLLTKLEKSKGYEFSIITKEFNEQTGYFETKKYIDCTIDEFPTTQFESKKITEIELTIKARTMKVIA